VKNCVTDASIKSWSYSESDSDHVFLWASLIFGSDILTVPRLSWLV
jgi:hypothetical protein